MLTWQEISYWKRELEEIKKSFLRVWQRCPICRAQWTEIAWDAEYDHEYLIVECRNHHLFRADDLFWLYSLDDDEVFAPKEEVVANVCEAE